MKKKRKKERKKFDIILLSKVRGLGTRGQKRAVPRGYLQFLIATNKITTFSEKLFEEINKSTLHEEPELKGLIEVLYEKPLFFELPATSKGVLFNSIKLKQVTEKIKSDIVDVITENNKKEQWYNIVQKAKNLYVSKHIKHCGVYPIEIEIQNTNVKMFVSVYTTLLEARQQFYSFRKEHVENS